MSVPKWKRNSNERLDLFIASRDFAKHILIITSNEGIFLPEHKMMITYRLQRDAIDIYTNLMKANSKSLEKETKERIDFQNKALESIADFVMIWDLAKVTFHIKSKKDAYAIGIAVSLREATKKWIKNDADRIKKPTA